MDEHEQLGRLLRDKGIDAGWQGNNTVKISIGGKTYLLWINEVRG